MPLSGSFQKKVVSEAETKALLLRVATGITHTPSHAPSPMGDIEVPSGHCMRSAYVSKPQNPKWGNLLIL